MNPLTTLLTDAAPWNVTGLPLPYSPRTDDVLTLVLLCCFLASAYVLGNSRKLLCQLGRDFLLQRGRGNLFNTSTATDMHSLLLLVLQACVVGGIFLFRLQTGLLPQPGNLASPHLLLAACIGGVTAYLTFKWLVYSLVGWIFFDETRSSQWMEAYSSLLYYASFALFALALFAVYTNFSLQVSVTIGAILLISAKMLIFYKWLRLFCRRTHGVYLLILYFCALEIVPCFVFYRSLSAVSGLLINKNLGL